VYRVAREALRNAFCHAAAKRIETELTYGERVFRLRIRDDGQGIPPEMLEAGRPGHYGISGMRERARQIGAKLDVWSRAKAGTEVELSLEGSVAYGRSTRRPWLALFRKRQVES
jgi:signal transduction histidine kinase